VNFCSKWGVSLIFLYFCGAPTCSHVAKTA
jgi:hypothetical protein